MKITLRTATIGIYALASLAGCERKAAPAAQTPNEKAPVAVAPSADAAKAIDAAAPVDQTPALFKAQPAPTRGIVECTIYDIKTVGLPAISDDGTIVAIGNGDDGGRGELFAQAVVVSKNGQPKTLPLHTPGETQSEQQVPVRATAINALFATGTWRTMQSAKSEWVDFQPTMAVKLGDYEFALTSMSKPTLEARKAGKALGKFALPTIAPDPAPRKRTTDTTDFCGPEQGYLHAVHLDDTSKRALIEIGRWSSGHNCGAGMAQFAVITLP